MARACTTCQHLKRPEIDGRLAAGEPTAKVARDYDINPSSLHRHRANCLKLGSANAIKKEAARGSAAVALLPSKEILGGHYLDLRDRIDQIVAQAQAAGSLAVAVSGLNSLRQTLDSLARLGGHVGGGAQVNVAIQNNVNVDARQIAERLITKFDHELALPSGDDTVRGLTVDAWIVADEAARLNEELIAALRPMRARRPQARFAMLSTAWSRTDPFWTVWAGDDPSWIRLRATADSDDTLFTAEFLEAEWRALGEHAFKREYCGVPGGSEASLFPWELFDRATQTDGPVLPAGPAFQPVGEAAIRIPNPFHHLKEKGLIL
jgi:hypothetical protein